MAGETATTILVVDDESGVRLVLERMLDRLGYHVVSASTGRSALEIFGAHSEVALIVLDLGLPDMTGDEVLEHLRRLGSRIPVLLSSGVSSEELEERLTGENAVAGVLRKPFRLPDLKQAVKACLETSGGSST